MSGFHRFFGSWLVTIRPKYIGHIALMFKLIDRVQLMNRFRQDNTEGYSDADLAAMNEASADS
jgi:hypothetical protein